MTRVDYKAPGQLPWAAHQQGDQQIPQGGRQEGELRCKVATRAFRTDPTRRRALGSAPGWALWVATGGTPGPRIPCIIEVDTKISGTLSAGEIKKGVKARMPKQISPFLPSSVQSPLHQHQHRHHQHHQQHLLFRRHEHAAREAARWSTSASGHALTRARLALG